MAEVTVTSGYPKRESMGSRTLLIWKATDVDDTETLTTNLGSKIVAHWVEWTGNPGTQTSAGGHSTESGGLITLYPSSDDLGATVFVLI
jgi:hypothetical protein